MAIETPTPRSRRAILAAALGAGAATIASALGRPLPAQATDGDVVQVGHEYSAATVTRIDAGTGAVAAFWGKGDDGDGLRGESNSGVGVVGASDSSSGVLGSTASSTEAGVLGISANSGVGVQGYSGDAGTVFPPVPAKTGVFGYAAQDGSATGVMGGSTAGIGLRGSSDSGYGVFGESASYLGVFGGSGSDTLPAILGESGGSSTGVQGFSGGPFAFPPPAPAKTGVAGYAAQDAAASGVRGESTLGRGVVGLVTSGLGVYGVAASGSGVRGYARTGTGGVFGTSSPKTGTALRAIGKVRFDNCAGVATIAAGHNSVVVTPGIDLSATSAVVATLQGTPSGTATVRSVAVNATADTFTIYLTANATAAVKVAWHVFG